MSDDDGIQFLARLIRALHTFTLVDAGIVPTGPDPTATQTPYAWIYPIKWGIEKPHNDGDEPMVRSRICHFEVLIQTRPNEPNATAPEALATEVQQVCHGAVIPGPSTSCICETGLYHRFGGAKVPQHRLTITGHFTYDLPF